MLLHRCQLDTDDEVRDRATYYKTILQNKIQVDVFVFNDLDVSLACLERSLVDYVSNQDCSEEFNLNSVQKQQYHAKKGPVSSHLSHHPWPCAPSLGCVAQDQAVVP